MSSSAQHNLYSKTMKSYEKKVKASYKKYNGGKVCTVLDNSDVCPYLQCNFVRIYKDRSMINMGMLHGYADDLFCKYSNGKVIEKGKIWLTYIIQDKHIVK